VTRARLVKFISFNCLWLLTAVLATTPFVNAIFAISLVLFFLIFLKIDSNFRRATLWILVSGIVFDSICLYWGWIYFSGPRFYILPLWLISLWLLFAWLVPDLILQFKNRRWVLVGLSALAGPSSYYAGGRFGIVEFYGIGTWIAYSIFWALVMFASCHIAFGRINGRSA